MPFETPDPAFAERVRASFARQRFMATLGARLVRVEPGLCEIELDAREELTQQHGYLHAGAAASVADSAGGYAAYTLMPADSSVLSIEFKVNLLAPGRGQRFLARGTVVRPGRRITVCEIEVEADDGERRTRCLFGLQSVFCLPGAPGGVERG
jgi:uncharacterized protein (TIGR00369 family)